MMRSFLTQYHTGPAKHEDELGEASLKLLLVACEPDRAGRTRGGAAAREGEFRCAFGTDRVHVVANPALGNATSVHAYSPPLLPLNYLNADGL